MSFAFDVKLNGISIQRVKSTKFLGVIIDEHVKWSEHIMSIKSKMAKGIGILYKAKKILPITTIKDMYYTFVYPYLVYCNEIWGSASDCYLACLFKLQKRVVRLLTSSGFRDHTDELFKMTKVLTVYQIYKSCILHFMFKYYKGILPNLYTGMFQCNANVHSHNTRQSRELHIPRYKHSALQKSVGYQGVKLWNQVLKIIDTNCSLANFKQKVKSCLIEDKM